MSDAIRCGECRWFKDRDPFGTCERNPPVHIGYPMDCEESEWQQPVVFEYNGCSHGQRRPRDLVFCTSIDSIPAIGQVDPATADKIVVSMKVESEPCQ